MNKQVTVLSIAGVLFALACAPAVHPGSQRTLGPTENEQKIAVSETEIARMEAALTSLYADAKPDCSRVCQWVTNICDLAKRICDLANQDRAANLGPRCQDANLHCESARKSTAGRCECQTVP